MEFKRRGTRSFSSAGGEFSIRRPTGPSITRKGLRISARGRDYEIRMDGDEIWLIEGDREVGYAKGSQDQWRVIFDERILDLEQPKPAVAHTYVKEDGESIGQFAGTRFPIRSFRSEGELRTTDEETTFLAAIVLTGWRESDRGLLADSFSSGRVGDDRSDVGGGGGGGD